MTRANDSVHPMMTRLTEDAKRDQLVCYDGTPLTKREHFSIELLKSILAASNLEIGLNDRIELSVKCADKLIEELNRTEQNKTEK